MHVVTDARCSYREHLKGMEVCLDQVSLFSPVEEQLHPTINFQPYPGGEMSLLVPGLVNWETWKVRVRFGGGLSLLRNNSCFYSKN